MTIWPNGRPSERIRAVLMGRVELLSEEEAIQSACSRYIYEGAKEILELPDKEARRRALSKIPQMIRPHIEAEIMRLHGKRR